MGKFKAGDKEIAKRSYEGVNEGKRYTIAGYARATDIGEWVYLSELRNNTSDDGSFMEKHFEPAPLFAVGDKVRVVVDGSEPGGSNHAADIGEEFTVTEIYDTGETEIHTDKWYFYPHEIEPVAVAPQPQPPLTITAGKFYRTRDGRKVGPATDDEGDFDVGGWLYTNDGKFIGAEDNVDYRHHIIAEWIDEPATSATDPIFEWTDEPILDTSTTGFTVPLDAPEFGGGARFKVGDRVEIVGCTGCKTRFNGSQFTIDSDEGDFGGEKSWSGKDNKSPYRFKESELRLVAEATSSKDTINRVPWVKQAEESVTTIADIVRRLEALEGATNDTHIRIGDKVTLSATVTGINKRRVNIVIDGVPQPGRALAVPAAALTLAA